VDSGLKLLSLREATALLQDMFFVHGPPPGYPPGGSQPPPGGKKDAPAPLKKGPPHKEKGLPHDWEDLKVTSVQKLQHRLEKAKTMLKYCATKVCKDQWTKELENITFLLNKKLSKGQETFKTGKKGEKGTTAATTSKDLPKDQKKLWVSAGGVVVPSLSDLDHVYVIKPAKGYGPYSFPKGRIDKGESMGKTARREVEEEAGIQAAILPNGYLGKGTGSFSVTHFFLMVQTGGSPSQHDEEVEEVRLVHWEEAIQLFKQSGNRRDVGIMMKARERLEKLSKKKSEGEGHA